MNGHLQGFLNFLDLLAEGQRRQAEIVTGRRFEAPTGLAPVQAENVVKFPLTITEETDMNAYSTIRNTGYAAVIVAALAGIVSNALSVDQRIIYERAAAFLPSGARHDDCEPVARRFITMGACFRSGMTTRTSRRRTPPSG